MGATPVPIISIFAQRNRSFGDLPVLAIRQSGLAADWLTLFNSGCGFHIHEIVKDEIASGFAYVNASEGILVECK